MASEVRAMLGEHPLMPALLADEQLNDDVRLFVLCTMAYLGGSRAEGKRPLGGEHWLGAIAAMAHPGWAVQRQWDWVRMTVASDKPRYAPDRLPADRRCVQVKADGQVCGNQSHATSVDRHPITGRGREVAYCIKHWSRDLASKIEGQDRAWRANGKPEPAPNTGGHLVRYLEFTTGAKDIWDRYYTWAVQFSARAQPSEVFSGGARRLPVAESEQHDEVARADTPGERTALSIVSASIE